jgi:hypothetical protein
MANTDVIAVEGLKELTRAFRLADTTLSKELRVALRQAAEPVRADAESLAVQEIRKIGVPWSRMRVGVTQTAVYVAPRQRGRSTPPQRRRPNLADLLLGRSMVPALEENHAEVLARMDQMLATVGHAWEAV